MASATQRSVRARSRPSQLARSGDRRSLAALALGIGNHFLEAMDQAAETAGRRSATSSVRLVGHLAVGLVSLRSDRHEKDVHWLGLRYRGFAGSRFAGSGFAVVVSGPGRGRQPDRRGTWHVHVARPEHAHIAT